MNSVPTWLKMRPVCSEQSEEIMRSGFTGLPESVFRKRIETICGELNKKNLDAIFVFSDEYRPGATLYLSDYYPINVIEESPQGVYISGKGEVALFLGSINSVTARNISWIEDIRSIETLDSFFEEEKKKTGRPLKIGLAGESLLPVKYYRRLTSILEQNDFIPADDIINRMRLIKTPEEVELMKAAGSLADASIRAAVNRLREGDVSEVELAAVGEYAIRKVGGCIGSATVLASGTNTMKPTWRPNLKKVLPGEVVLLDFNPSLSGYCADTAITVIHETPSSLQAKVLEISRTIHQRVIELVKPGDPASRIYEFFLQETTKYGYADEFKRFARGARAVGHSVGLDVVEWPDLDKDSSFILEPGMVFGIKFDLHGFDFGGIRQEVEMLVEENKCCSLNNIIYEKP
jgi:Xaa-Pro dipeptidase